MSRSSFDLHATANLLESATTESGRKLVDLMAQSSILLVFLRHAGCTFCRETLSDISKLRSEIEARGTHIVLVHMGDREAMLSIVAKYGLSDLERIADSTQVLYAAFGLGRGSFRQLFGWKVWWRGVFAGLIKGHGRGAAVADYRQMPGVFYLEKGMIAKRFRHKSAADRPPYESICSL